MSWKEEAKKAIEELNSSLEWRPSAGEWVWDIHNAFLSIRPQPVQVHRIDDEDRVWCLDSACEDGGESQLSMKEFVKYYRKALPEEIP